MKYAYDNTNVESAEKLLSSLPEEEIHGSVKQLCGMLALGENKKLRDEEELEQHNIKETKNLLTDLEKNLNKLRESGALEELFELTGKQSIGWARMRKYERQTNKTSSQKKPRHD